MTGYNLRTVISFEVVRALTKRRFWILALSVPLIMGVVIALIVVSNSSTSSTVKAQKSARFSFSYLDPSGYVDPAVVKAFGGSSASDAATAVQDVRAGKLQAFFAYPRDPTKEPIKVFAADSGIFDNGKYSAVATQILVASAKVRIGDAAIAAIAQGSVSTVVVTYRNGAVAGGFGQALPPLLFLLIFYIVIVLLGNQMLTSTLEEKENRVTEMILTTVDATTLIVGKIAALFIIGFVQIAVFCIPVVVGYVFFRHDLKLPSIDLASLTLNPSQMIFGVLLLIGGFALFTGTLVALGAIMPTAKEAGQVFGVMMALIFVPFYAASLVVSDPHAFIVGLFTYFPYSAPVTAMLRNGLGTLSVTESVIVVVELFVVAGVVLRLAIQLFRFGAIEYSKRVSIRTALSRRSS